MGETIVQRMGRRQMPDKACLSSCQQKVCTSFGIISIVCCHTEQCKTCMTCSMLFHSCRLQKKEQSPSSNTEFRKCSGIKGHTPSPNLCALAQSYGFAAHHSGRKPLPPACYQDYIFQCVEVQYDFPFLLRIRLPVQFQLFL